MSQQPLLLDSTIFEVTRPFPIPMNARVIDFPCAKDFVTSVQELRRQCVFDRDYGDPVLSVVIDSRRAWPHTGHQRCPRRVAHRCSAVGSCKRDAPFGQSIDIRSFGLGIASQMAHPVIQVVNRDE